LAVQGYSYSLSVQEGWKTSGDNPAKLRVDLSDCPVMYSLDSEYLVFAKRNYRGQMQLPSCDHIVHTSEGSAVIEWLHTQATNNQAATSH